MEISFSGNFNEINDYLLSLKSRSEDTKKLLGIVIPVLAKNISENFKEQHTPEGISWQPSKLSQIDPTGSPRKTLMRSTDFYQDLQDKDNYVIEGDYLNLFTSVTSHSKKSNSDFFYGAYHNTPGYDNLPGSGRWPVAGPSTKGQETLNDEFGDYLLNGKISY